MSVKILLAYDFSQEIKLLFSEYTDMLIEGDPSFKKYLEIQNYDDELKHLEKKYGLPYGRLYLAYYNNEVAGCIGLKKIDEKNCEMKRLYVRPKFRGKQIGEQLIERIIKDAKEIGYSYMLLDTLPFLKSAIHLYKKYGFYEITSYNNSPMDTSIYMKLDL
ncbi:GNAT family N-acetyltransferase [Fusobacterium simiae]|uniref:GNAT family N-acetyltransferase n=1 Tax=Fusobacterium simiae TaxID=855 RepID=A0ABT4DKS7_FUSSI|nr:GNAT family N-acetyltransferase [Fusobacterium simiae]MCY7008106.1 GNAT family N-acetyltransferase [Fusobacterium simiae]